MTKPKPYFVRVDGQQFYITGEPIHANGYCYHTASLTFFRVEAVTFDTIIIKCDCGKCKVEDRTIPMKGFVDIKPVQTQFN